MIELDQDFTCLAITPVICIAAGECPNPECDAKHWTINLGRLFWTVIITF